MWRVFIDEDYDGDYDEWFAAAKRGVKQCPPVLRTLVRLKDEGLVVDDLTLQRFVAWAEMLPGWTGAGGAHIVWWTRDHSHRWPGLVQQALAAGDTVSGEGDYQTISGRWGQCDLEHGEITFLRRGSFDPRPHPVPDSCLTLKSIISWPFSR